MHCRPGDTHLSWHLLMLHFFSESRTRHPECTFWTTTTHWHTHEDKGAHTQRSHVALSHLKVAIRHPVTLHAVCPAEASVSRDWQDDRGTLFRVMPGLVASQLGTSSTTPGYLSCQPRQPKPRLRRGKRGTGIAQRGSRFKKEIIQDGGRTLNMDAWQTVRLK